MVVKLMCMCRDTAPTGCHLSPVVSVDWQVDLAFGSSIDSASSNGFWNACCIPTTLDGRNDLCFKTNRLPWLDCVSTETGTIVRFRKAIGQGNSQVDQPKVATFALPNSTSSPGCLPGAGGNLLQTPSTRAAHPLHKNFSQACLSGNQESFRALLCPSNCGTRKEACMKTFRKAWLRPKVFMQRVCGSG